MRVIFWKWAVVLVAIMALVAAGYLAGERWLRETVEVAAVERGRAVDVVPGVIEVSAGHRAEVRTERAGRVTASHVEVGQRVGEGDVLVRLDTADLDGEIERLRIELEAEEDLTTIGSPLRYELMEAEEEVERLRQRLEEGRQSRRELVLEERRVLRLSEEIRREAIRENRRLAVLRNELADLERQRERMTVRSPVDGDVVEVYAFPGDVLSARGAVVRVLSADRVVEASISEEDFAGVREGQAATVRFLGYGTRTFDARVSRVLPAGDPETQRYTVHLDVDMEGVPLAPGLTGETSILVGERADVLIVPRRALWGREVFVVREGRAYRREVEPGFVSLNLVEIRSGLEEGDQVVVENIDRLRDGDRVRFAGE